MVAINEGYYSDAKLRERGWYPLYRVDPNTDFIGITEEGVCVRCRKITDRIDIMGGIFDVSYYILEERYSHCVLVAAKNPGYGYATWLYSKFEQVAQLFHTIALLKRKKDDG